MFHKKLCLWQGFFIAKPHAQQKSAPREESPLLQESWLWIGQRPTPLNHLIVTLPPTSSMAFLRASASSLDAPSLTTFGAAKDDAEALKKAIEEVGGKVTIK